MLMTWVFVLLLINLCSSGEPHVKRAWPQPAGPKIFGGVAADACWFPFQILLFYDDSPTCGGSIINERTILTAAHCVFDDLSPEMYRARAGEQTVSIDGEEYEQDRQIDYIVVHDDYDPDNVVNDVAILHVDQPFTFNECVRPVHLSDAEFDEKATRRWYDCDATGFGIIGNRGPASDTLLWVPVRVVTNQRCNRRLYFKGYLQIPGSNICTMDRGQGTCRGDSGGPMGCYDDDGIYRQVGVTSWGPFNCNKPPNVFARVSSYLDWIDDYTVSF